MCVSYVTGLDHECLGLALEIEVSGLATTGVLV